MSTDTAPRHPAEAAATSEARSRRWHRGPKGASVLDLIFKYSAGDGWSATLRSDPSVILVADNGSELASLTRDFALAMLQDRGQEALDELRRAGSALPGPPGPDGAETGRRRGSLAARPRGSRATGR